MSLKTGEEYKVGVITQITDYFRVFSDMESGLRGYYDFLDMKRYASVRNTGTPEAYLQAIKAVGYCTSSTYVNNCLKKISQYDLTQYDSVLTGRRATLKMGSRGKDVVFLQQQLTAKGYNVGAIDGIFGLRTLEGVKACQGDSGLVVDGIVGVKTWSIIE